MGFGSPFNRPRAGGHPAARPLLVAVVAGVLVAGLPPVASAAPTPGVSIGDVTVAEGNAGTTSATFTIQASPAPKNCCALQVAWATAASTAAPPGDYTTSSGTVSLTRTTPSRTVTVPVVGDALDEPDETFVVNLSNLVGSPGRISDGQGVGTIVDDDPAPSLSVGDVSVTEGTAGTTTATFTISLSAASGRTVSVGWATADDEAMAPSDYAAASGTLTFAPGDTAEVASVSVNGDVTAELDERFAVVLSSPTNATIGDDRGVGTILDDEMLPVIDIDDPSVAEGASGTRSLAFEVSLSNPAAFPVRVDWATGATGTATPGTDHTAAGGTITFAPFDTSETAAVPVVGDVVHERDETVHVDLSNAVGAPIGDARGVGTISNDDPQPSFSVGDASVVEGDSGATVLSFLVTLTGATDLDAGVDVATADGTAAAGEDYASAAGHLAFPAGTSSATVDVTVSGDTAVEPDERFTLWLSAATDATIADASATGTIVNDDAARTTITLKVAKLRRVVRASGVLEPTATGHRVTVTLFRKRGARFAKIASKAVRVKGLRDRDGDGRPDGAYAASFRRPTGPGRFKVTARFRPRPGYLGCSRSRVFSLRRRR